MIAAHDVVERALALVTVDEAMVVVTDTCEASLRWAGNSMTTNGSATSRATTVIAIVRSGGEARVGSITATCVEFDDIASVVAAAESAARAAQPASDAAEPIADDTVAPAWSDAAATTSIDAFAAIADDLSAGFDGSDRLYGFADHRVETLWLGTSSGVRRRAVQPIGSLEINGKRGGASAWAGAATKDFTDVVVPDLLAEVSRRLDWAGTSIELPAGRYETLMPPSTVADMMIYLLWTMEGRGAQEGRNALSAPGGTRVGEQLSDLPLTLYSDPSAAGLEYPPFVVTGASSDSISLFDNGMAAQRADWIRNGAVNALAYPRSAAAEFGAPVAVPGDNLLLTGGSKASIDDMIARTERGLLLTTLWYIREVDPTTLLLTGLTRDGVYLIEDGAVRGAVNNFRFNESPLDLLRRATEAGATQRVLPREWKDYFTRTAMPPLRIPDFHMSSVSKAT